MEVKFFDGPLFENFYNEWILTNGKGGYALGFGNLISERKYDSLLTAGYPDRRRINLVSAMEEKCNFGSSNFYLDSNNYPDVIYPAGYRHLVKTYMRPYPSFIYSSYPFNAEVLLMKEVLMHPEQNITVVRYTNLSDQPFVMNVRPKCSCRNYHDINSLGTFDRTETESVILNDLPSCCTGGYFKRRDNGITVYFYFYEDDSALAGEFLADPRIYRNIFYSREADRGYDSHEDLFAPFLYIKEIGKGESFSVIMSDTALKVRDKTNEITKRMKETLVHYGALPLAFDHPLFGRDPKNLKKGETKKIFSKLYLEDKDHYDADGYISILRQSMLDFMMDDGDIIAGYPWFTCWGRDTMISLEAFRPENGLLDGKEEAFYWKVLDNYAQLMDQGRIPNVIGERNSLAYNTVDASLWFVMRSWDIFKSMSKPKQKTLLKSCASIVLNYLFNDSLPYFCDKDDRLIEIREGSSLALTWMDAVVDGVPVTPRYGKPVEINGLWYNALLMLEQMMEMVEAKSVKEGEWKMTAEELYRVIETVKESMCKFFADGVWVDRIEKGAPVPEIRPNFVIALSLPFPFETKQGLQAGIEQVKRELLTPYGLRTLNQSAVAFKKKYLGTQKMRDLAYHQGTVWPWLLLPYAKMLKKGMPNKSQLKRELEAVVFRFRNGFMRNHKASVAEVWDGQNPHLSKGTPTQAWSCAAVFCIEKMIEEAL